MSDDDTSGEAGAYNPFGRGGGSQGGAPSSAEDPLKIYRAILADPKLSNEQKDWLLDRAVNRFRHRRRLAFGAFAALMVSLGAALAGAVADGIWGTSIVANIQEATTLLGLTNSLLTGIIGAYYGVSSLRPSS